MKTIGRSKVPLYHQIPIMVQNLSKKLNVSVNIEISIWQHSHETEIEAKFYLNLVPGVKTADCSRYEFKSWESLVDHYYYLIKEGV
jgi:hypothetical protein